MAMDSQAVFRPAKTPVSSAGTSSLSSGQSVAVIAGAWRLQPADVLEERDAA